LPDDASRPQQLERDRQRLVAKSHRVLNYIADLLESHINELRRSRSATLHTEHMAQQQEEKLVSHDEITTVSASDSQSEPSQSSSRKRKYDKASSSRPAFDIGSP
jgi:hypothetical protein